MRTTLKTLALLSALVIALPAHAAKKNYSYYRVGSSSDVATSTAAGIVMMGGSTDVNAAFEWMCALSGDGDFLIVRAAGTDAYNPYIRELCPNGNSVATLIIPSVAAATDPFVANTIASAEALWIAGGDQSNYVKYWTGTPVQAAINALVARGAPIGGTSAGLNMLTQFIYSAMRSQGVDSSQALADPYTRYITLARDFVDLPVLTGVIGDPHFAARDRMGRDLAFLCRIAAEGWSATPRAIAVDERTALLIDAQHSTRVVGEGKVYFIGASRPAEVCVPGAPLTYRDVGVYRIDAGAGSFDLGNWRGRGGVAYSVSAEAGVLGSNQPGGSVY